MQIDANQGLSDLICSEPVLLSAGHGFTEGPAWIPSDDALLFSDIPGNRILRWRSGMDVPEIYRAPSGWANGLTLDRQGRLLACEQGGRRVSRSPYDSPFATESVAESWDGTRLNSPNDLAVHSSGAVLFTDPTYGTDDGRHAPPFGAPGQRHDLPFRGLYVIDPAGGLHLLDTRFAQPNGLALGPGETHLYVGDSAKRLIWRYEMTDDVTLWTRILFVDQSADEGPGAPDGMKVDGDGRLWTTGVGGVSVYAPDGTRLGRFKTSEHAHNLVFGGSALSTLFLTAWSCVYRIETAVTGIDTSASGADGR